MSQSSIIFFFLLIGFVIFITLRGELSQYAAILGLGGSSAGSGSATAISAAATAAHVAAAVGAVA